MLDTTLLTLAFTMGMVAAVNPCGFAMLPAYVSFFLGSDDTREPGSKALLRAFPVGLAVSAGFVAVFAVLGTVLRPLSNTLVEQVPWATIVIGAGLVVLGIAMVAGFELSARLPKLNRGGRERSLGSMFLFGVSYAVASLSCTIGIFLGTVVGSFDRESFLGGLAVFVAYAAGMGLVMVALTIGIAMARNSIVTLLRNGMRHVNRVGGVLLTLTGGYVAWYGVFSLRLREDPTTAAGPAQWVEDWSAAATRFVDDVGATRLGLLLVSALAVIAAAAVLVNSLRSRGPEASLEDAEPASGKEADEDQHTRQREATVG